MRELHNHWKGILARGIAAILFGFIAFSMPDFTLGVLVYVFAAFFVLDGVIALLLGASSGVSEFFVEGLVGIAAGVFLFFFPLQTVSVFFYMVAFWAFLTGLIEVLAAIRLREYIKGEFWLFLAGVISLIFGVVVFFNPLMTAVVMTMFLGLYTLFFGVLVSMLALRVRNYTAPHKKKKK